MQLHAYTRTISDLFSVQKKYIVPRFQRPYSWKKSHIEELWEDITNNITLEHGVFHHSEYFIGTLVLVGDDKKTNLLIVDGQQRLTTITILLSVLCRKFDSLCETRKSEAIYNNYIIGETDDGDAYFKLENESPKPFLQNEIQHIKKMDRNEASTDEEKNLQNNFDDLFSYISVENLSSTFGIEQDDRSAYIDALVAIREQVLKHLKVIYITVEEEEEAYTIFETLNARGMDLSSVDLIKNTLFKNMQTVHPDDDAKTKWKSIYDIVNSRSSRSGNLDNYVRHWWISRYSNASKDTLYKNFKRELKKGKIKPETFISELYDDSKMYKVISFPYKEDFPRQEDASVYDSLQAFKIFNIAQQKPFFISLFRKKEDKVIAHKDFVDIITFLEDFHFVFNAICSQRASGLDQIYARSARGLFNSKNKIEYKPVLSDLKEQLIKKVPEKDVFIRKFCELKYLKKDTADKKLIQYIFNKIESFSFKNKEFSADFFTLEHIEPQDSKLISKKSIGKIGNLLPLGNKLNAEADNMKVNEKISIYRKSDFMLTQDFADTFSGNWHESDIDRRTRSLAEYYYDNLLNRLTPKINS
jgi:uncharacterized protein with ParB-like and HNH nuclease domain